MSDTAVQIYKPSMTLTDYKKLTGVDLDALQKALDEMDTLLSDAYTKVNETFKAADADFVKLDDNLPSNPDEQPAFMDLTDDEADVEYKRHGELGDYHCEVEKVVIKLDEMRQALGKVTS